MIAIRMTAAAAMVLTLLAAPAIAEDAMSSDAMAPMSGDAMAPMMSDDELKTCLDQAAMITFPSVMEAAAQACHDLHNGMAHDAMGGDAMSTDAMAPKS